VSLLLAEKSTAPGQIVFALYFGGGIGENTDKFSPLLVV